MAIALNLVLQEYNNNLASDKKDNLLKLERERSDSIITTGIENGIDSGNKVLFGDISVAFSKQGLGLDTMRKEIFRLQDSVGKKINIINGNEPFFSLCKDGPITLTGKYPDRYVFNLNVCNSSAPSRNINAKVYVVSIDSLSRLYFLKEFDLLESGAQMDEGARITQQLIIPTEKKFLLFYFLVKGSWTNIDSTKTFKINLFFHYDMRSGTSGGVTAYHDKILRSFLKSRIAF